MQEIVILWAEISRLPPMPVDQVLMVVFATGLMTIALGIWLYMVGHVVGARHALGVHQWTQHRRYGLATGW